mgnify:CR=1 FL=1
MEDECYICADFLESPLITDICECKHKIIHISCFRKLIDKVESKGVCGVCKTQYKNVSVHRKIKIDVFVIIGYYLNCFLLLSLLFLSTYNVGHFLHKIIKGINSINNCKNSSCLYSCLNNCTGCNYPTKFTSCKSMYINYVSDILMVFFLILLVILNISICLRVNARCQKKKIFYIGYDVKIRDSVNFLYDNGV